MRVLVTGGNGFLGKYVTAQLEYHSIPFLVHNRKEDGSLTDYDDIIDRYQTPPDTIIHLAAVVGGIGANKARPYDFIQQNLLIGLNMIDASIYWRVKKFIMVSTVCGYPANTPIPFKEEDIWNGYPEPTNAPYGIAKRTLTAALWAANQQYGLNSVTLNLANLYGVGDSHDIVNNHVIPAIVAKIKTAKLENKDVVLWGDGTPTRDFLHASDAARAIYLSLNPDIQQGPQFGINIGTGVETSIREVANLICELMDYDPARIIWDSSKPNGQSRRVLDIYLANTILGYIPKADLRSCLATVVAERNLCDKA